MGSTAIAANALRPGPRREGEQNAHNRSVNGAANDAPDPDDELIPLEVVVRNVALGSVVKRYGVEEGKRFDKPVVEFFHKSAHDPLISDDLIAALGLIPDGVTTADLKRLTHQVNELFVDFFEARDDGLGKRVFVELAHGSSWGNQDRSVLSTAP